MILQQSPVVLITGASRGIGKETALAFGQSGFRVAVHFHKEKTKALSVVDEINNSGGYAFALQCAIENEQSVKKMMEMIVEDEGRIDILVNNASVNKDRSILKMSKEEWNEVIDTDLSGTFNVLQECSRVMAKQRSGSIINIASIVGVRGSVGNSNYACAKAGVIALTKAAARELGRFNIRVNAILPGFHMTDMGKTASGEYVARIREESVLGITTDIRELVEFLVFLAQKKTVSGQVFNWDSRII
jgi:3-oxoacyl-[acyl-carrier protein] reductase